MLNTVIDLSHHNIITNFNSIKAAGVAGIIHKATQGTSMVDKKYRNRQRKWQDEMKMLWGAYHFASSTTSGRAQADHFLKTIFAGSVHDIETLMVLDYEHSGNGLMKISEAENFVHQIFIKTGRWPMIYSGNDIKEQWAAGKIESDSILKNCPLWIAQYGPRVKNIPGIWETWTLWQYTDGAVGPQGYPKTVPGIGPCDRDLFNGSSYNQLAALWNLPVEKLSPFAGNENTIVSDSSLVDELDENVPVEDSEASI